MPIPASTCPSPDQASCLRAPPAPDHPMCCVSGSLVIMFCLQGDELGKGVPTAGTAPWGEVTPCPGRGRQEAVATAQAFSGGRRNTFLEAPVGRCSGRRPDRNWFCCSRVSGAPKCLFASVLGASYPSADLRPRLPPSLLPVCLELRGRLKLRPSWALGSSWMASFPAGLCGGSGRRHWSLPCEQTLLP